MTLPEADVAGAVARVHEEMVQVRRALHRLPELSLQEHRTAAAVAERCEELGMRVRAGVGGTGVLADLDGRGDAQGRPTVMVRADIDALPVQERGGGRVATSEVDGVMHACGHDGHTAIALGTARVLGDLREQWSGRVRFCFQPAEEVAAGALPMIEEGALDGVDMALGLHLWAPLQVGRVAVTQGPVFGSADDFGVTVTGRGGHGGMPHTAVDAVVVAAQIVTALQTIVSRETSPLSPAVVTVGRIEGGTAFNVIAEQVRLRGTVRALEGDVRERVLRRVGELAAGVARAHGADAAFERGTGCPPVVSDAGMAEVVRRAAVAALGEENVDVARPVTVGDDVAYFLERVPGCYFLVGAADHSRGPVPPHHHPEFDIDERCLDVGATTLARAVLLALERPPGPGGPS